MSLPPLTESHPGILDQVRGFLDEGLSKAQIARRLEISRDRLRTLMKKYDLCDGYVRKPPVAEESVNAAFDLFVAGTSWKDIQGMTGIDSHAIRRAGVLYGYDIKEMSRIHRLHRWDGRVFGSWSVVSGTTGIEGSGTVMTECVCGKRVVNLKSNLLSSASQGCGCIGYKIDTVGDNSQHYQWTCLETGEVVETTNKLAKHLHVNNPALYRHAFRGTDFEDPLGYTWRSSKCVRELQQRRDLSPDLNFIREQLAVGQSFLSIAKMLDVEVATMYKFAYKHSLKSQFIHSNATATDKVLEVRRLHSYGMSQSAISIELCLSLNVVHNIVKGKTHTNVVG